MEGGGVWGLNNVTQSLGHSFVFSLPQMNSTHKVAASGVAQLRLLQHLSPRLIHSAQKTFSRAPP